LNVFFKGLLLFRSHNSCHHATGLSPLIIPHSKNWDAPDRERLSCAKEGKRSWICQILSSCIKTTISFANLNLVCLYLTMLRGTITGFLAGRVDVTWVTSGDAIEMIYKDPTIRMIYVVDYSNGSDGMIGRGINSPQNLKGKTIGRENLLFENVLLRAYLEKGGLTEKDVVLKDSGSYSREVHQNPRLVNVLPLMCVPHPIKKR